METIEQKETGEYIRQRQQEEWLYNHKATLSMAEAINALSQQLNDATRQLQLANERVAELESIVYPSAQIRKV